MRIINILLTLISLLLAGCPAPTPGPQPVPPNQPGLIHRAEAAKADAYAHDLREIADQIRGGEIKTPAQAGKTMAERFAKSRSEAFRPLGEAMNAAGSLPAIEALLRQWATEYEEVGK